MDGGSSTHGRRLVHALTEKRPCFSPSAQRPGRHLESARELHRQQHHLRHGPRQPAARLFNCGTSWPAGSAPPTASPCAPLRLQSTKASSIPPRPKSQATRYASPASKSNVPDSCATAGSPSPAPTSSTAQASPPARSEASERGLAPKSEEDRDEKLCTKTAVCLTDYINDRNKSVPLHRPGHSSPVRF